MLKKRKMKIKRSIQIFSLLLMFLFVSCATPGTGAKTIISNNFHFESKKRIAILPFITSAGTIDVGSADISSVKLMELGFVVVERLQIEQIFKELKLNYSGALSQQEIKKIGKLLNIDMLVFGTVNYRYVPAYAYSKGGYYKEAPAPTVSITQPGVIPTEEKEWVPGSSEIRDAYYALESVGIRMVDIETGEVLLSSICRATRDFWTGAYKDISDEIAESIKQKLDERVETNYVVIKIKNPNGYFIAKAEIEILQNEQVITEGFSNENGEYTSNNLPLGIYQVNVWKKGYIGEEKDAEIKLDKPSTIIFMMQSIKVK